MFYLTNFAAPAIRPSKYSTFLAGRTTWSYWPLAANKLIA